MQISGDEVRAARQDEEKFEALVQKNRRFILYIAFRTVHHFVSVSDDEWSTALLAFHEAVRTFDEEKGDFRSFAALVIRRRLQDELGKAKRREAEISVDPVTFSGEETEETGGSGGILTEVRKASTGESMQTAAPGSNQAKDEIEAVQELLQGYGFSFYDLVSCSPKAGKTKEATAEAVRTLLRNPELFRNMRESHSLPMKELSRQSGVAMKILERHRKYIIAAAEILNGEYPLLASYMDYIRKGLSP